MDGPDPVTITVIPAEAFIESEGPIMLRAWRGVDGKNNPVVALIGSVRSNDDVEFSPVPRLSQQGERIGEMSRVIERLTPSEFIQIVSVAELLIGFPNTKQRRESAHRLCASVVRLITNGEVA